MSDAQPGDRVLYRTAMGADLPGRLLSVDAGGCASIQLEPDAEHPQGWVLPDVERNPPEAGEAVVNVSWRPAPAQFSQPPGDTGPIWLEALAAGLVVMLCEAADGNVDLQNPLSALEAFKRGVGFVLRTEEIGGGAGDQPG